MKSRPSGRLAAGSLLSVSGHAARTERGRGGRRAWRQQGLDLSNRVEGDARVPAQCALRIKENPMPTIRVDLFEGRTPEQKKNLVKALTQACVDTLGSKPESVDILLFDVKPSDWATGGELWSEKKKQG
jgi:4-oxalocrotonate tautomerase